jgi:hypothetical protein
MNDLGTELCGKVESLLIYNAFPFALTSPQSGGAEEKHHQRVTGVLNYPFPKGTIYSLTAPMAIPLTMWREKIAYKITMGTITIARPR